MPTMRDGERERDALRAAGQCAGIGVAACLEPIGRQFVVRAAPEREEQTTTWMDSCRINVDGLGFVTATIHTTSSGQGHETLAATVIGEVLQIDPDLSAWCGRIRSIACRRTARWQPHGDHARRRRIPCRAASSRPR